MRYTGNEFRSRETRPWVRGGMLLFLILMFCYSWIHQRPGWNENSRLDLLHALARSGTWDIDSYHKNTGDKAVYAGHFYSDKAPGIALIAIPAFWISKGVLEWYGLDIDSGRGWFLSSWITTVGSVGLLTALGGSAFFAVLLRFVPQHCAFMATLAVFLGSLPFPYATMLFSHGAVIGMLCIAVAALVDDPLLAHLRGCTGSAAEATSTLPKQSLPLNSKCRTILAGACCGLAVASEYTAALSASGVVLLVARYDLKRMGLMLLGVILPLAAIPAYNWMCFDNPFAFGYHNLALAQFQEMNKGLFGITFPPKPAAAYLLLFSSSRGLFFWSPFLLMCLVGFLPFWKRYRPIAVVALAICVSQVIAISGYYMPSGGAALGPRHLAPMIPFIGILAAMGLHKKYAIGGYLGLVSIILTGVATAITAKPGEGTINLLRHFYSPKLLRGEFLESLGSLFMPMHLAHCLFLAVLIVPYVSMWYLGWKQRKTRI